MEAATGKITAFHFTGRSLTVKETNEANGEKLILSFLYVYN